MATIPATFRAYRYAERGSPAKVPLSASQVRVKVLSASLNPVDSAFTANYSPPLLISRPTPESPFGIGSDGAGIIVEVGSAVEKLKVGDSVFFMTSFMTFGTFAEYIAVEQDCVAHKPASLSFDQATSVPLVGLTSYQVLVEYSQLQKGERVLILGGSSAAGMYAIQIAKAIGAYVIATTSSRNSEFVKSFGADELIDYTKENWGDVLDPHSIDVLYDCGMEPDSWNTDAQQVLKKETGRFVTLLLLSNSIEATFGAKLVGSILVYPSADQLNELTKYIESGKLVTPIDSVYELEHVLDAVEKSKTRRARGKIVIKIANE